MGGHTRLLGVVDQAVASSSNVIVTVAAARALSAQQFGGFAVAMVVVIVLGSLVALVALEPLLVRGGASGRVPLDSVAGAALALGAVGGIGCIVAGALLSGVSGAPLALVGGFLPLLFLQDGLRHAAFAVGLVQRALFVDLVWMGLLVLGLVAVAGSTTATAYIALWAVTGSVAAAAGLAQQRVVPSARRGAALVRSNLDLGGPFALEFMAAGGAAYAGLWLLGVTSGLVAVGAVRVGQTIYGPINVLYTGILLTLVPQGARLRSVPGALRRSTQRASLLLVSISAIATAAVSLLPTSAGVALFGESWYEATAVLFPLGVALCGGGAMAGAIAGFRSLGRARTSLRIRLATLPLLLFIPSIGAIIADQMGFSIGLAAATWTAAAAWWFVLLAEIRSMPRSTAATSPGLREG